MALSSYRENPSVEKVVSKFKSHLVLHKGNELLKQVVDVNGIHVLAASLDDADDKTLRETMDNLKNRLWSN
ncbi:hypothetical protein [Candidatus Pandoraea novymonadis]|uniref:Uncharacterized protein n=1 Tax=Candidatus Pandoraea novymonadis TaxID=1808959 RepID=A0ABX5FEZ5_9BURK|nr:hypothetical protein [Candidatus Pandoraea novymonadis]PSB92270.1 hypothetical protein BZL35_00506 [Candidatus Pandoraea novymonadis]